MHPTGPAKKPPVLDWRHVIVASVLAIIAVLVYGFAIHP
jgi:hypothetical protein